MEDDLKKIIEKYSGLENTSINRLKITSEVDSFIRTNYYDQNQIYNWKVQCNEENNPPNVENIYIYVFIQKSKLFNINELMFRTNPIKVIRRKKLDQINDSIY